jgi:hypothetical protein
MEKEIFTRQFPIFRGAIFALILKIKFALVELDASDRNRFGEIKGVYSVGFISALSAALPLYRSFPR